MDLAGIYANPDPCIRNSLWDESSVVQTGMPALVARDFNTLLGLEDKCGGAPFQITAQVNKFWEWIDRNQLQSLVVKGGPFTWCNNRRGMARAFEILDRAVATSSWLELFPYAMVEILPRHVSDHAPLLVRTTIPPPEGPRPFRFEKFWLEYPSLGEVRFSGSWRFIGLKGRESNGLRKGMIIHGSFSLGSNEGVYEIDSVWCVLRREKLIAPFTVEEIEWAVRKLPLNKAPSPDGFPREFYKSFWPVLKRDLVRAMQNFQVSSSLPISWGTSHIALVPKIETGA
ncbi:hypothetical protein QJS10_CPB15g00633 [Acorus calamus]|uniref:Reverse transcriptase n=1 Tax=Acorus calamus TaxID=4465 RepID=A0AAV9D6A6_ACOCL|nr:hypothetical protein QJS10_CPB15g00633 [Acorus calamus]